MFTYNSFPQAFRNQVFYILEDVLEPYSKYDENLWNVFEEKKTKPLVVTFSLLLPILLLTGSNNLLNSALICHNL